MIYLDNSASTLQKPKEVLRAVNEAMTRYTANPGRSGHKASLSSAMQIQNCRSKLKDMFNAENEQNVIFTDNCSGALNLAILGTKRKGGHIICSENDHNSVLRAVEHLKDTGEIEYDVAFQGGVGKLTVEDVKKHLKPNTYMVICNHISNVNGDKADIEGIGKFCHEKGLLFLVDGAQSGGHEEIDMQKCHIDYLALAPHKGFYSMQGLGVLIARNLDALLPIKFGGTGTNSLELRQPLISPERYEVGTLATPNIVALNAGIDFVNYYYHSIREKLDDLTTFLNYSLSSLPVKIYTTPFNSHGVLAYNISDIHSNEISSYLNDRWGICVRGGYHCAGKKHEGLKTLEQGAVRVSVSYFNSISDIQHLVNATKSFLRKNKML